MTAAVVAATSMAAMLTVAAARPLRAAAEPDRAAAGQLLLLVNSDRAAAGLAPLLPSLEAASVAESWSAHMADINDLAHNDAWFSSDMRRHVGAGVVGENVATNIDVADAHRRLMASPGHRANILDPRFHQVGIGAIQGATGSWWITEDFFEVKDVVAAATAPVRPDPAPAPAQVVVRVRTPMPPPTTVTTAAPPAPATVEAAALPEPGEPAGADVEATPTFDTGELAAGVAPAVHRPAVPHGPGDDPVGPPLVLTVTAVLVALTFLGTDVIRLLRLRR